MARDEITPQQEGRLWEPLFAESIGASLVKNSGAGFAKLDVRGATVLWSLKWAGNHRSLRVTDEMFEEAKAAIHGPGGVGGSVIPAVAFKTEADEYVCFRKSDALLLFSGEMDIAPIGGSQPVDLERRKPALLRDLEG